MSFAQYCSSQAFSWVDEECTADVIPAGKEPLKESTVCELSGWDREAITFLYHRRASRG